MSKKYFDLKIDEKIDSLSKKICIDIEKSNVDEFQLKMIMSGCSALIKPIVKFEENSIILEYDVSNMISIDKFFNFKKSVTEIIDILLDLIDIMVQSTNNYLDYSKFVLDKRFMFYNNISSEVMLIYVPLINFKEIDVLEKIKSELFKGSNEGYSSGQYSKLLFAVLNSSTLMGLKHSLIDMESIIYEDNKDSQNKSDLDKNREVGKIIDKSEQKREHISKVYTRKEMKLKDKSINNDNKSQKPEKEMILRKVLHFIISILIITGFIFLSILFDFPMIPSFIVGVVISILVSVVLVKNIGKKEIKVKKIDVQAENVTNNGQNKTTNMPKTVLISDIKSKYKLTNQSSGEVFALSFELEDLITLGRSDASHICINENSIGRNHLNLINISDLIYVYDNNSLNGTFINQVQIKPLKKYLLENGDVISIGETKLMFEAS